MGRDTVETQQIIDETQRLLAELNQVVTELTSILKVTEADDSDK